MLLPAVLIGSVLLAAWPGYLSFDSGFQWQQARTGQYADIAPPMLPWLWSLLLRLGLPATSGPLLLIGGLHAWGFAALSGQAHARGQRRLAWLLAGLGPCCPLLLLMLPHVWTDLLLSGSLLAAFALLAGGARSAVARVSLALLLIIACGVRHNAVLAVLPLLIWWALLLRPFNARWRRLSVAPLLLLLVWSVNALLVRSLSITRLDTWAVTPLFDLQAVSVAENQQLLPVSVVGPGMDVKQLKQAFHPYSATRLFSATTSGVSNPTVAALRPQQRQDLLAAWRRLPLEPSWWAHRARLFCGLLGPHLAPDLRGLADSPMQHQYADNPDLQQSWPDLHALYRAAMGVLRHSWLLAPGVCLLLGLGAAAWRWRQLGRPAAACPEHARERVYLRVLLSSAWLYTLPYFVLAPSAESRYLLWPVLASWLVLLLSFGVRTRPNGGSNCAD